LVALRKIWGHLVAGIPLIGGQKEPIRGQPGCPPSPVLHLFSFFEKGKGRGPIAKLLDRIEALDANCHKIGKSVGKTPDRRHGTADPIVEADEQRVG